MGLDDYSEFLAELLPAAPLYLGALVGLLVLGGSMRWYRRVHARYGTALSACGLSGELVAHRLLADCELNDVRVVSGRQRDQYHPWRREIQLNPANFSGSTLGAVVTAAHEVGHARQFAERSLLSRMRRLLWPVCAAMLGIALIVPLLPFLGVRSIPFDTTIWVLFAATIVTLLVQLPVTLPLERDASCRARRLVRRAGLIADDEQAGFDKLLRAAWLTYAATEAQRWLLVLAVGMALWYLPPALGDPIDGISSVEVVEEPPVRAPQSGYELPPHVPTAPPAYVEVQPIGLLEAFLPGLLMLAAIVVILWLLAKLCSFADPRAGRDLAIEKNNQGLADVEAGSWTSAVAAFDQALRINPRLVHARYNRGYALVSLGRLDEALSDFDQALELEPRMIDALVGRGDIWLRRGDMSRAVAEYERALALSPQNATVLTCLGYVRLAQQDYERAQSDFEAALRFHPREARAMAGRALLALGRGDLDGAQADLERSLALGNPDAIVHASLGRVWLARDEHARAIRAFDQALALTPDDAAMLRDRGLAKYFDGRHRAALDDLNRSLALDPTDAVAWNNRGAAHLQLGDYAHAADDLNAALARQPTFANPHHHLAWLYATSSDSAWLDRAQAIVHARRAVELGGTLRTSDDPAWQAVVAATQQEAVTS
jgi:tetratricopeptide (TPR) repeat protein